MHKILKKVKTIFTPKRSRASRKLFVPTDADVMCVCSTSYDIKNPRFLFFIRHGGHYYDFYWGFLDKRLHWWPTKKNKAGHIINNAPAFIPRGFTLTKEKNVYEYPGDVKIALKKLKAKGITKIHQIMNEVYNPDIKQVENLEEIIDEEIGQKLNINTIEEAIVEEQNKK